MKKKIIKHKSKVTTIFEVLCKEYDFDFVITGPDQGYFIDHNNIRHEFDYGTIDLNESKHIQIADDKEQSSVLMKEIGIPIPEEILLRDVRKYTDQDLLKEIVRFSKRVGFPLICKPLNGRQGNNLIKIESKDEIVNASKMIIDLKDDVIIQEYLKHDEVRVVVLDGEIIQAYKRFGPSIVGDGKESVFNLIEDKNAYFKNNGRNTIISIDDPQVQMIIADLGYSNGSIPEKGKDIPLSFGRNLSKGGEYEFIENKISPKFQKVLREMSLAANLRLVGFDLFIRKEISLIKDKTDIVFIEYNGSPDMENNFYYCGDYYERLLAYYRKIFHAMTK